MSIRCRTWPKVHHIVRTPLLPFRPPIFRVSFIIKSNIRDVLEARLICFIMPLPHFFTLIPPVFIFNR
jgi:hypothetical protein